MKSRYKKAKRILTFYYNNFGFKPPYLVLVCGTFCKQALMDKINIAEQLPKYLNGEVKLLTTKCAIKECELGGSLLYGPFKVLSQFDIYECPHSWFKGSAKCLRRAALKQKNHFIVATQDEELAESLREHNIPLLHISHNCINLEAPSDNSKKFAEEKTTKKLLLSQKQEATIAKLKEELHIPENDSDIKKKKKKRKGPNPLSCKKPQKKTDIHGVSKGGVESIKKRMEKKEKNYICLVMSKKRFYKLLIKVFFLRFFWSLFSTCDV
ncbi:rRNA-processing protein UTP23 homolog [Physella acuta]|uniref:rRNA-processing protein UTP23 homolog n=1 Tax=Physella acuta TaxID=109671 RepID=UPI0027DC7D4F|nr:rRNA-processing protein UTP23 homolog [Physella acuta]